MNKANLKKPTIEDWRKTEEIFIQMMDTVEKNVFDLNKWKFINPKTNEDIPFRDMLRIINEKGIYVGRDTIEATNWFISRLPGNFKLIQDQIMEVLKGYLRVLEERIGYQEELEAYANDLEADLNDANSEIENFKLEKELFYKEKENLILKTKLEESNLKLKALKEIGKTKDKKPETKNQDKKEESEDELVSQY